MAKKAKSKTSFEVRPQNNTTTGIRETVLNVFRELQSDPNNNLEAFAKKYPDDYNKIAAKLSKIEIG